MADSTIWGKVDDKTNNYVAEANSSRKVNNKLGKDAFLQLLMAQMKYQDPMSPMDNKDSVAQLAQFSALEQMQQVSSSSQKQQAYSLMGKVVSGTFVNEVTRETEDVVGKVTKVSIKEGEPYVTIDGKDVALTKVSGAFDAGESEAQVNGLNMINGNLASIQSIGLIGKTVQAVKLNEKGEMEEFIEGKVDYLKTVDNKLQLVIGSKEVPLENVMTVSDNNLVSGRSITIKNGETSITGAINNIEIKDGKFFTVIGDTKAEVSNMNDLIKALAYVGKEVKTATGSGVAEGITLTDNKLFVKVGDELVSLATIYNNNK